MGYRLSSLRHQVPVHYPPSSTPLHQELLLCLCVHWTNIVLACKLHSIAVQVLLADMVIHALVCAFQFGPEASHSVTCAWPLTYTEAECLTVMCRRSTFFEYSPSQCNAAHPSPRYRPQSWPPWLYQYVQPLRFDLACSTILNAYHRRLANRPPTEISLFHSGLFFFTCPATKSSMAIVTVQ